MSPQRASPTAGAGLAIATIAAALAGIAVLAGLAPSRPGQAGDVLAAAMHQLAANM